MRVSRRIWWSMLGGLIVFAITSISFFTWPAQFLAVPLIVQETPQPSDVIIVLGAGSRKHPSTSSGQVFDPLPPQAKERVNRGKSLLDQGYAPRMILAGGYSKKTGYTESTLMRSYALSLGVRDDQIIEENQSKDTWENATNTLAIMRRNDWSTALVVTSSYHTLRSCTIFRRMEATVRCIPASLNDIPTVTVYERLTDFRSVVREYGAIIYFVLKHRL